MYFLITCFHSVSEPEVLLVHMTILHTQILQNLNHYYYTPLKTHYISEQKHSTRSIKDVQWGQMCTCTHLNLGRKAKQKRKKRMQMSGAR